MNKITNYIKASFEELTHKVTWTNAAELQNYTTIVLVSLAIITVLILVMDKLSELGIVSMIYDNI